MLDDWVPLLRRMKKSIAILEFSVRVLTNVGITTIVEKLSGQKLLNKRSFYEGDSYEEAVKSTMDSTNTSVS